MEHKKLMKQLIKYNRTSFNNMYSTMVMLQEQAEKMTDTLLDHPYLLPEEGKKVIKEWAKIFKDQRIEYKKTVDENFEKLDDFFND